MRVLGRSRALRERERERVCVGDGVVDVSGQSATGEATSATPAWRLGESLRASDALWPAWALPRADGV